MTGAVGAAALLAGVAVLAWPVPSADARRRLACLYARGEVAVPVQTPAARPAARGRVVAALGAGAAVALFAGLPWGALLGGVAAVAAYAVLGRIEPAAMRRHRERMAADLPVGADLLSACLRAGSPPVEATDVVAQAVGGPLGDALRSVAAVLRLGGDPVDSWAALGREPALAPLGRAVGRATSTGAPLAAALDQIARESRDIRRVAAEESARKVGVKVALPLGLCFLPAFVLLGVVPVVAGIVSDLDFW